MKPITKKELDETIIELCADIDSFCSESTKLIRETKLYNGKLVQIHFTVTSDESNFIDN